MNRDKKHTVGIILGKMSGGTESGGTGYMPMGENDSVRQETGTAKKAAVQRLLSAIEHRDPEGIQAALETFMELCSGEDYDDRD